LIFLKPNKVRPGEHFLAILVLFLASKLKLLLILELFLLFINSTPMSTNEFDIPEEINVHKQIKLDDVNFIYFILGVIDVKIEMLDNIVYY
jgi:hypothetical protein